MTSPMRFFLPAATAIALTVVAAVSFARAAEPVAGDIVVTEAWARATPPGAEVGAVYATLMNNGETSDRLIGAASPAAQSVVLHETREAEGVARMRPMPAAEIPAKGRLAMTPGGPHLMLTGLTQQLRAGETIALTLSFETGGSVTFDAAVAPIGAAGPADPGGHDHSQSHGSAPTAGSAE